MLSKIVVRKLKGKKKSQKKILKFVENRVFLTENVSQILFKC